MKASRRVIVSQYRYDPDRHERCHVVVAAFDNESEYDACVVATHAALRARHDTGEAVDPSEHVSGTVHEPGYRRLQQNGRLLRRAAEHGVWPPNWQDLELPSNVGIVQVPEERALIDDYRTAHVPVEHPLLLPRENGRPLDRHTVTRFLNKAGAAAGLPHIHPHQLRHTLATQAINRGMSLEAIAAMLGHRSMDMTLRYAKIANRTVADEYFAVTDKVDALYAQTPVLPAQTIGPKMARLRREHHRLLGNGHCTRPPQLDCAFEAICETCAFFQTSIEFRPTLQAQHDDAKAKGQQHRADLFAGLLTRLTEDEAS